MCRAPKVLYRLEALPQSAGVVEAWVGQVYLPDRHGHLEELLLKAHREDDGTMIQVLSQGNQVLRRGHIGGYHANPGPHLDVIKGPHIHYPTTRFHDLRGRGRSHAHVWDIVLEVTLREALDRFCAYLNIVGPVEEKPPLLGGF